MQEMTRRDFLKGAAMAGGAVMLGGLHGLGRVQSFFRCRMTVLYNRVLPPETWGLEWMFLRE